MKKFWACSFVMLAVFGTAASASANDGDLDLTWGGTGIVTVDQSSWSTVKDVAPYGSNKVVVAGTNDASGSGLDGSFLARLNEDGSLDTTCGGTGIVFYVDSSRFNATSMLILDDGSMLLAGYDLGPSSPIGRVLKFGPNCALDTTFGIGGTITYVERDGVQFESIAKGPNSTLIVGGSMFFAPADGGDSRPMVARLLADGSLDATFGDASSGRWVATANHEGIIYDLLVASDGSITFTGIRLGSTEDQMVGRLNASGAIDTLFATAGWYTLSGPNDERGRAIAPRANGGFVVVGVDIPVTGTALSESEGSVLCVSPAGAPDSTCAGTGRMGFSIDGGDDQFWDVAVDDAGRFVVSGSASSAASSFVSPLPFVMRLLPNLTIDSSFGSSGSTFFPFNVGHLFTVNIDRQGRILSGGIDFIVGPTTEAKVTRLTGSTTTTVAPTTSTIAPSLLPATGRTVDATTPIVIVLFGLALFVVRRVRAQSAQ